MKATFISLVVSSQHSLHVQPASAESYDYPAAIANECQRVCDEEKKCVILLGKNSDRFTFFPSNGF